MEKKRGKKEILEKGQDEIANSPISRLKGQISLRALFYFYTATPRRTFDALCIVQQVRRGSFRPSFHSLLDSRVARHVSALLSGSRSPEE